MSMAKLNFEELNTNFLVIGSGIAGLYTAFKLSELGDVIVVTKDLLQESNTQYAQGGIAAALNEGDSWKLHMNDTLKAGAKLCDRSVVAILTNEGRMRVEELIELGMKFDRIGEKLDFTREGAHTKRRVLHAGGDATGKKIRETLTKFLIEKNVKVNEKRFVVDLLTDEFGKIHGALAWNRESGKYEIYRANIVVLASGGCGQIYENTTNPQVTTGDGVAIAYRAGAEIVDMEFIQFHPTALYNPGGLSFLISESVRGEGAVLRNSKGERFMPSYHELAELAPRDIVARAIVNEIKMGDKPYVWLDATSLEKNYIGERFPTIFHTLKEYGIDMRKEWIPVAPAAHYMMGGIKTDKFGRTNLENLYACGEVACTGVHGANRLASNSLLEGLVFAHRIYEDIKNTHLKPCNFSYQLNTRIYENTFEFNELKDKLRKRMMEQAGIERKEEGLKDLRGWLIQNLQRLVNLNRTNEEIWELKNMLTTANLIVTAALLRTESRGAHFRKDHPKASLLWENVHIVQKNGGDDVLE